FQMTLDGDGMGDDYAAYQRQLEAAIWANSAGGSPDLAKTCESLAKIREELVTLREKYLPSLVKTATSLRKLKEEVVEESAKTSTGELSIAAQFLIEQDIEKAEIDLRDIVSDHRSAHTAISKSGKDIDRYLGKNLSGLFKGQKDLDCSDQIRLSTSELICKHIHTSGYIKSSAALVKDAGIPKEPEKLPEDRMDVEALTFQLKEKNLATLDQWVKKNEDGNYALRADLDKLRLIKLIQAGERTKAIEYCKTAMRSSIDSDREFGAIITAAFMLKDSRVYLQKRLPAQIDALQKRIMYALTYEQCLLPYLLNIGIQSIPNLMHIRQHVDKRPEFMFSGDEFPLALYSECDGHCTVNCPILRQQVTKENPAMRISCGHVMSKDAVTKLSAQSSFRGGNRIKCPYCPSESTIEQAQELKF
ncbi:hypothetical protein PMAYCL1PPCAC_30825, partial [Pristionchus mayeri]